MASLQLSKILQSKKSSADVEQETLERCQVRRIPWLHTCAAYMCAQRAECRLRYVGLRGTNPPVINSPIKGVSRCVLSMWRAQTVPGQVPWGMNEARVQAQQCNM